MAHIVFDDEHDMTEAFAVGMVNQQGKWHDDPRYTTLYILDSEEARDRFLAKFNGPDGFAMPILGLRWVKVDSAFLYNI